MDPGQLASQSTWELKTQRGLENEVTRNLNPGDRGEKTEPLVRFGFHIKTNSYKIVF